MALNRRIVSTGIACLMVHCLYSQNAQEWTKQKKTQIQYLVQQIAALQVYLGHLKDGYDIVNKGLNLVGDIKDGNFTDHSTFFESLSIVNPEIAGLDRGRMAAQYNAKILQDFQRLSSEINSSEYLQSPEKTYILNVKTLLTSESGNRIDELNSVLTNHSLTMSDDERLKRIDSICDELKSMYSFTNSFCNSVRSLTIQRAQANFEIVRSSQLFNTERP
jgi:hypothetical protein